MERLPFEVQKVATGSRARAGRLQTLHAAVPTPMFMPVGTHATVRGQRAERLEALGFPMLLANTYHLLLRPGAEVFERMGGIHRFMGWGGSVLTDSGGFQIFSLPNDRTLQEEGAVFTSYLDARRILLTPERSIAMQKALRSDIMMALDQCLPSTSPRAEARAALELTTRWARRSLAARGDSPQALFGIVQGACYPDLRRESALALTELAFDGFAVGGLAVGESRAEREDTTELTVSWLPPSRPRYLMGVGTPLDLLEGIHRGIDLFDCIIPTSLGGRAVAFTWNGRVHLRRGVYRLEENPLDPECGCTVCARYSCAYLHHLLRVNEPLGPQLVSEHNLSFYAALVKAIRASILSDDFSAFYARTRERLDGEDPKYPITRPRPGRNRQSSRSLPPYEVHEVTEGVFSLRHLPSGEVMHSVNRPEQEARALYLDQSRLLERLATTRDESRALVLWDVGLGAAINAMTVIREVEKTGVALRPLHIVSFENDLTALRLVRRHPSLFPHVRHAAPGALLEKGTWRSTRAALQWSLLEGDFLSRLPEAPAPDVIYFDPFSSKTNGELWTLDCFRRIFAHCENNPTSLFTYSNATGVRGALLAAGFFVAKGAPTGPKNETTVALSPRAVEAAREGLPLLTKDWLARWERSHARLPLGLTEEARSEFERVIREHPQFGLS